MNKKIMIMCILIGVCITLPIAEVSAIKVVDINTVLSYPGGYFNTSGFYAQKYDKVFIRVTADDDITIQLRTNTEEIIVQWVQVSDVIDVNYILPKDGLYLIYLENLGENVTSVIGGVYLDADVSTSTTTTTPINRIVINMYDVLMTFLTILGIVIVILIALVLRKRRAEDISYLIHVHEDELLPKGWESEDERA